MIDVLLGILVGSLVTWFVMQRRYHRSQDTVWQRERAMKAMAKWKEQ